jgi:chaperonin GroEL
LNIEDSELDVLGSADKVIISKDDTIIMGGSGEKKIVEERVTQIQAAIEITTSDYDKEKL